MATQDFGANRWRLSYDYPNTIPLKATVLASPPQITLAADIQFGSSETMTVLKRVPPATNWTTVVTSLTTPTFTDNNVVPGQIYEYQCQFSSPPTYRGTPVIGAVINRPVEIAENRGKVTLLVDTNLLATFRSQMESSISQLQQDLVGDGWTVLRHDVPRHVDDYSSQTSFRTNAYNITNIIKPLILADYSAGSKGVLILGHVSIPYSGTVASDGHVENHQGAWPADIYYADVLGTWTDTNLTSLINPNYPENTNVQGDGKFDQDTVPMPLKLFVGRIDFSRLTAFGTSNAVTPNELALLQQYCNKDHSYRYKLTQFQNRGIVYGDFQLGQPLAPNVSNDWSIYSNAKRNMDAMYQSGVGALDVGDPLYQRSHSYTWGFLAGSGANDSIGVAWPSASLPYLQHSASNIQSSSEALVAFQILLGSYFGDWNMTNDLMRATLTRATNGLANVWIGNSDVTWDFYPLGYGDTLGASLIATVNNTFGSFPLAEQRRELTILGDPTLRLHILTPPTLLDARISGSNVTVSWQAADPGATYYIYRAGSTAGPFTRLTTSATTSVIVTDNAAQRTYLVRSMLSQASGCGTYNNLSAGAFATAHY